mmetsp:Transcript_30428/g.67296  ORF Transcript_30428/g.67296 Transcript_30428/m.67296 type:complete len:203 (+) Transcript_30428:953-1561(+)
MPLCTEEKMIIPVAVASCVKKLMGPILGLQLPEVPPLPSGVVLGIHIQQLAQLLLAREALRVSAERSQILQSQALVLLERLEHFALQRVLVARLGAQAGLLVRATGQRPLRCRLAFQLHLVRRDKLHRVRLLRQPLGILHLCNRNHPLCADPGQRTVLDHLVIPSVALGHQEKVLGHLPVDAEIPVRIDLRRKGNVGITCRV